MFGYSLSYIRGERKYKDFFEYTVAKEEKAAKQGKIYMPYIVVGIVFLLISFVFSKVITII